MSENSPRSPAALLETFLGRAVPGPFAYPACHHFPGRGTHGRHLVLGFVIHGNESGTLPAALALQKSLTQTPPPGPVTLVLGNLEAVLADVRFLDEDFNRVFTFDRPAHSRERRRAEQVRPILDAADLFLDFHQTQTPTALPFWTFPYSAELARWARIIGGARHALSRKANQAFSPGLKCLDEYVRDRGKVGLTLEVGFRGQDPEQAARTLACAERTVEALAHSALGAPLADLAAEAPEVTYFETAFILQTSPPELRLRPGLQNWVPLHTGERLSAEEAVPVLCPFDGYALFPKYPREGEAAPPELLRIAREVADPDQAFGS